MHLVWLRVRFLNIPEMFGRRALLVPSASSIERFFGASPQFLTGPVSYRFMPGLWAGNQFAELDGCRSEGEDEDNKSHDRDPLARAV